MMTTEKIKTYAVPNDILENMRTMHAEGRIIRDQWQDTDAEGRELACLLGAMGRGIDSPEKCPATFMPAWLAHLTPSIDDNVSDAVWPEAIARYIDVAGRWHVLSEAQWDALKWHSIRRSLVIAEPHDKANVVRPVLALIDRQLSGDAPAAQEWADAADAADAAAADAVADAADAVAAAAAHAAGAAWDAAWVAAVEAWVAADAAWDAADAADAAWVARTARTAWDSMVLALLSDMENEIGLKESST